MPANVLIVLEREDGAHGLHFGEYNLDLENHILYIGIGDFGQGGGVTPVGTLIITENGTYNVKLYENAQVEVLSPTPSGTLTITTPGLHDVSIYEDVNVSIPQETSQNVFFDFLPVS